MNYKGFDKDLKCRGFQYEIGKEYETENAVACHSGFHACEYPLDIFGYYNPVESRFCEVIQSGETSKKGNDSKVASTKIKIGAEVEIHCLVKASIEYISERAKPNKSNHSRAKNKANSATGDRSANSSTGNRSANSATGDWSANSATGNESANSSTGYWSANSSTGNRSANSATGDRSANSSTGNRSANSATGNESANSSTGYWSANSSTGNWSANSATGDGSANSSTGNRSANSATGDGSANSSTGFGSANSSTGDGSANSSTGFGSANISTGDECNNYAGHETSIAVGWGTNNKCKGVLGAYIVCSEWEFDDDSEYHYKFIGAKMAQVDGKVIKADTFYTLKHGEFVEVD